MFKMVKPGLQPVWLSTIIQLHTISRFATIPDHSSRVYDLLLVFLWLYQYGAVPAWGCIGLGLYRPGVVVAYYLLLSLFGLFSGLGYFWGYLATFRLSAKSDVIFFLDGPPQFPIRATKFHVYLE